jgi:hypothetical protein
MPMATIEADSATGNPARVSTKGSVTFAKPALIPCGRTRTKNIAGEVDLVDRESWPNVTARILSR